MFRRQKKIPITEKVGYFFWPKAGWRRSSRYLLHRLARMPGTPYSIAAGFACGAAVSFTPFVGLHFLLAAVMAFLIRANVLTSAIGTAVGNPWTFPFIWVWVYELGAGLGAGGAGHGETQDFANLFGTMLDALLSMDMAYLAETTWPVWWPMLVGSIPTFVLAWIMFYLPLKWAVEEYQARRHRHRKSKLRKNS